MDETHTPDTPELNENLAPAFVVPDPVSANAEFATVYVPVWDHMDYDDVLTVSWGGEKSHCPLAIDGNR